MATHNVVDLREYPFLRQLIPSNGLIFRCDADAPSPSKDYGQLEIYLDRLVLRWWKISLRNIEGSIYPGVIEDSYEDFYHDERVQREIWRIFGPKTFDYVSKLISGQIDWLTRLPHSLQIRILSHLNLDDIPRLSLVSKQFRSLCRHNDLWKIFYLRQHPKPTVDLVHYAERRGWRKVFFTNRLKLQMELRREAKFDRHHRDDPSDLIRAKERKKTQNLTTRSLSIRDLSYPIAPLSNREGSADFISREKRS